MGGSPSLSDNPYDGSQFQDVSPEDGYEPQIPDPGQPPEFDQPSGRPQRQRRPPPYLQDLIPSSKTRLRQFQALVPQPPPPVPTPSVSPSPEARESSPEYVPPETVILLSEPNEFGLFRASAQLIANDTESDPAFANVCDNPSLTETSPVAPQFTMEDDGVQPGLINLFGTWTAAAFITWHVWTTLHALTPQRSQNLVDNFNLHDRYNTAELVDFNVARALRKLDHYHPTPTKDSWQEDTIEIPLPYENASNPETSAPRYKAKVYHRNLLDACKSIVQHPYSKSFTYIPSKLFWIPPGCQIDPFSEQYSELRTEPLSKFDIPGVERIYDEFFHSDAWIKEHEKIQRIPPGPEGRMENGILALNFSSDGLRPAQFGSAHINPIYGSVGNDLAGNRRVPNVFSQQWLAFFAEIGDDIQEVYMKHFKVPASREVLSWLRRECHNATIRLLLNAEFMEAYRHGFVITCSDGIRRRIFPRIFVYSADYPEKYVSKES